MKISLCLFTKNELIGCQNDVQLIKRESFDGVFAIDGGSTDGTLEFLQNEGIPAYIQPQKGYNAAYIYAFEKCEADAIIFFHPKGTINPSDCEKFRNYFDQGYELIIASRNIRGAHNEEDEKIIRYRKWFVSLLGLVSAILFKREGNMVWDVLHGFRGMTKSSFDRINALPTGITMDLEMVIRSYKKKLKRIEFPTSEKMRIGGTTNFKALPTGWSLIKYMFYELFRKD